MCELNRRAQRVEQQPTIDWDHVAKIHPIIHRRLGKIIGCRPGSIESELCHDAAMLACMREAVTWNGKRLYRDGRFTYSGYLLGRYIALAVERQRSGVTSSNIEQVCHEDYFSDE